MPTEELRKNVLRDLKNLREKISAAPDPRREAIAQAVRSRPEVITQLLHSWLAPLCNGN